MGRGTHLCFPDAGMLHKFHVALAYLRNSAATRALWQNQRCHKLLPSGLKLHQKNDGMEARCCHNSSGLQSLLERQGDRAGGRGAEWSCTPARAPKVGRLHLTRYGPTIICSSSTRRASPGEAPPQVSAPWPSRRTASAWRPSVRARRVMQTDPDKAEDVRATWRRRVERRLRRLVCQWFGHIWVEAAGTPLAFSFFFSRARGVFFFSFPKNATMGQSRSNSRPRSQSWSITPSYGPTIMW